MVEAALPRTVLYDVFRILPVEAGSTQKALHAVHGQESDRKDFIY